MFAKHADLQPTGKPVLSNGPWIACGPVQHISAPLLFALATLLCPGNVQKGRKGRKERTRRKGQTGRTGRKGRKSEESRLTYGSKVDFARRRGAVDVVSDAHRQVVPVDERDVVKVAIAVALQGPLGDARWGDALHSHNQFTLQFFRNRLCVM